MSGKSRDREDVHPIFRLDTAQPDRLIHLRADELAAVVPEHVLFSYPKTSEPQDGFIDVSSRDFANAINRASWFLLESLGTPRNFDSVCYMGSNDIRYFVFMFAAIKVGYKMLFLSPRNNLEGHLNVLAGADCHILLKSDETNVDQLLSQRKMPTTTVPKLAELLDSTQVDVYPYTKTFEQAKMDPCLVLHTTGSTGLPKPITWKLGILSTYEAWRTIPHVGQYVPTTEIYQQSRRAYTSMPLFHTSGLNAGITWSLLLGVTLVYGAPQVLANARYTDEMHKHAGVDASMGAPSIYEDLSRDLESMDRMKNFHYVVASGAPLSQIAGTLISKHTRVISNLGATETACLQRLSPSVQDWDYYYWHPTHSGIEMREYMDGLYELFIVRKPGLGLFQGVFYTFPEISEWSMNDLYERHPDPEKPFLYRYKGRKDDVIVLSNGEKISPALMETAMMADPRVRGAMVVGRGKFQPAVLIDLVVDKPSSPESHRQLVSSLSPCMAKANEHAPAHAKLDQYHVLFADAKKPIHYLGQGKIQRHITYKRYEQEIDDLYQAAESADEHTGLSVLPKLDASSEADVIHWLRRLVYEVADHKELRSDQDMFTAGVDSLQVIKMARELNIQAKQSGIVSNTSNRRFDPSVLYQNPSLKRLAASIFSWFNTQYSRKGLVHGSSRSNGYDEGADHDRSNSNTQEPQAILDKYVKDLPRMDKRPPTPPSHSSGMVVVLTGSTGSLGKYLLDALYNDKEVDRIICLNRRPDAEERQKSSSRKCGLTADFEGGRVEFLHADLSRPSFGLDSTTYQRLLASVTHIIHNQWPVNFNWTVTSFEPHIRGVRGLIDFSYSSSHHSFLLFVSSVAAVGACNGPSNPPEKPVHDLRVATMGYGQSKLIAECLLDKAAFISGVSSACCRVGIIAGPVESQLGAWNRHEYIPSIIISSAHLGCIPATFESRDRIDWLPVDKLSTALMETLKLSSTTTNPASNRGEERGTQIYHVTNPQVISWNQLIPWVLENFPPGIKVKAVPFQAWVKTLERRAATEVYDAQQNPAVKLLEFYRGAQAVDRARELVSTRGGAYSKIIQQIGPVKPEWIANWMQQWGFQR